MIFFSDVHSARDYMEGMVNQSECDRWKTQVCRQQPRKIVRSKPGESGTQNWRSHGEGAGRCGSAHHWAQTSRSQSLEMSSVGIWLALPLSSLVRAVTLVSPPPPRAPELVQVSEASLLPMSYTARSLLSSSTR